MLRYSIIFLSFMTFSARGQYRDVTVKQAVFDISTIDSVGQRISRLLRNGQPKDALDLLQRKASAVAPVNDYQRTDLNELFGNCYAALKQYASAEKYYLEMMRLCNGISSRSGAGKNAIDLAYLIHCNTLMAKFYIHQRRYEKADRYIRAMVTASGSGLSPMALSEAWFLKFQVDSSRGNFLDAIKDFSNHKVLDDSILRRVKKGQIRDMQAKYETAKKAHDKEVLQSRQELQSEELKNSAQARNFTYIFIFALTVVLGFGYNQYRFKQKSNNVLLVQQAEINDQHTLLSQSLIEQQKLVEEKDWLLKEIHHRVKNNLQMVISLLNAQFEFLDNPSAMDAIKESRERMQAIALIHQKLYRDDNNVLINMHSYIHEMVGNLRQGFADLRHIHFRLEVDNIDLDVSQAVPVGLILNEGITNSLKYAFSEAAVGEIIITLMKTRNKTILLRIADNGQGFPPGFALEKNNSLGIQLIQLFSEQLEGELTISGDGGVSIALDFKPSGILNTPVI